MMYVRVASATTTTTTPNHNNNHNNTTTIANSSPQPEPNTCTTHQSTAPNAYPRDFFAIASTILATHHPACSTRATKGALHLFLGKPFPADGMLHLRNYPMHR